MAIVPVPITWATNQLVTAAQLNTNIRDIASFLLAPPLFVGRQTVAQSIATAAWTAIAWDATDIDRDAGHSNTTNNSRYTAQTAGWYQIDTTVEFSNSATGQRGLGWRVNGTGTAGPAAGHVAVQSAASNATAMHTGGAVYLNVADWVEIVGYQNSGAALNTSTNIDGNPRVSIKWISN